MIQVRFPSDQVHAIRDLFPGHFVTHNLTGLTDAINFYELAAELDFVSWDYYLWGGPQIPYGAAQGADLMGGLKRQNFWVMETNAGPAGNDTYGRNPRPGEMRKNMFQQVAHGADGLLWFRWRTCIAGMEQYWHGLLGHDGRGLRRYREAARAASDLHGLDEALAGTTVVSQIAIIYDYDSIWALQTQPGYRGNTYHAGAMATSLAR